MFDRLKCKTCLSHAKCGMLSMALKPYRQTTKTTHTIQHQIWKKKDSLVKAMIMQYIKANLIIKVTYTKHTKESWDVFAMEFSQTSSGFIMLWFRQLTRQLLSGGNVSLHVTSFQEAIHYLVNTKFNLPGYNAGCILHVANSGGKSKVYFDSVGWLFIALYSPMYLGINFLDLPLGRVRFSVDKYTLFLMAKGVSGLRCLFTCWVCVTWLSIMASCAISRLLIAWLTNHLTLGFAFSKGVILLISMGIYP